MGTPWNIAVQRAPLAHVIYIVYRNGLLILGPATPAGPGPPGSLQPIDCIYIYTGTGSQLGDTSTLYTLVHFYKAHLKYTRSPCIPRYLGLKNSGIF